VDLLTEELDEKEEEEKKGILRAILQSRWRVTVTSRGHT
jgi:hypothetical protein